MARIRKTSYPLLAAGLCAAFVLGSGSLAHAADSGDAPNPVATVTADSGRTAEAVVQQANAMDTFVTVRNDTKRTIYIRWSKDPLTSHPTKTLAPGFSYCMYGGSKVWDDVLFQIGYDDEMRTTDKICVDNPNWRTPYLSYGKYVPTYRYMYENQSGHFDSDAVGNVWFKRCNDGGGYKNWEVHIKGR